MTGHLHFGSKIAACGFSTFVDEDEGQVGVELWFRGKYALMNLHILKQDAGAINAELGLSETLDWIDEDKPSPAVATGRPRLHDRADWKRQHEWLAKTLTRTIQVIGPRLCTKSRSPIVRHSKVSFGRVLMPSCA